MDIKMLYIGVQGCFPKEIFKSIKSEHVSIEPNYHMLDSNWNVHICRMNYRKI